jgi:hypothetical protein
VHLVPDHALVATVPHEQTFAEMRQVTLKAFNNRNDDEIAIGCGNSYDSQDRHRRSSDATTTTRRRRLQHVGGPENCNNSTNFFCWMSCLDIPQAQDARGYLNEGYSLYCLDPAVLASTGNRVSQATQPCHDVSTGKVGGAMNSNCVGSWQPTAPGVAAQPVDIAGSTHLEALPFCFGGTSMYMDGFHWVGSTCVIYLFPNWILSSVVKLVGACLGSLALGVALEYLISQRRRYFCGVATNTSSSRKKRLLISAAFYGMQLIMGYTIMLIIMIYSVPLFLSAVTGLVGGHVLFNAKDCLVVAPKQTRRTDATGELAPERAHNNASSSSSSPNTASPSASCCASSADNDSQDRGMEDAEGITPCCQH